MIFKGKTNQKWSIRQLDLTESKLQNTKSLQHQVALRKYNEKIRNRNKIEKKISLISSCIDR